MTELTEATVVQPKAFSDAELVGDTLLRPRPVVLDLRGLDVMLTRRFIDFSAGLTFGLKATAEKMFDGVFLLQPTGIRLDPGQRCRLTDQP